MAITPSQWSHVVTIPESYLPSGSLSGYAGLITEAVIAKLSVGDQATFWSNVLNGGGDVRICTDLAGANQLPIEVVSLDNVAETCVIWYRNPTYTGAGDLYLFIGKAGETQPAVTDPFGRNAVWVDYLAVLHLNNSLVDSTGNGYNGVNNGATFTITDNPFGINWPDFDGSNDFINIPVGSALNNSFLTVQAITKPDVLTIDDEGIISNRFSTQGNNYFQITARDDRSAFALNDGAGENFFAAPALSDTSASWLALTSDATSLNSYVNGVLSGSDTSIAGDNQINTALDVRVGTYFDGSDVRSIDGKIGEVRLKLDTLSSDHISTEYTNQIDPASFYGTPTIATTGGGATYTITLDAGSYTYTGNAITLSASRNIALDAGSYAYTGQPVNLVYTPAGGPTYSLALDSGSYFITGEQVQLSANRVLQIDPASYIYAGSAIGLRVGRAISIDAGAYVVTGNAVQLSANRAITLEQGAYTYTGFPVNLSYSGEVIALISGYSVNYKQDDIAASYQDDFITARFS